MKNRHDVLWIEVAGVPYRYYSGSTPPPAKVIPNHPNDAEYIDIPAISEVSSLSGTNDPVGGIAEYSPITISLSGQPGPHPGNPVTVFSRLGIRSTEQNAFVTEQLDLDAELPFDLKVDRDLSGLSYPRYIHVGQEMMWATGADGSSPDAGNEDPYRVTITQRALANTRAEIHRVVPELADYPILTTPAAVWWRGRPMVLWSAPLVYGTPGTPRQIMRGFIDTTPQNEEGLTVEVVLSPLPMILEREYDAPRYAQRTTLVQGYHYFDPAKGSQFQVVQARSNEIWELLSDAAGGQPDLEMGVDTIAEFKQVYDITLPTGHPRSGTIDNFNVGVSEYKDDPAGDDNILVLEENLQRDVRAGTNIRTQYLAEAKLASIVEPEGDPEILVWPTHPDADPLDTVFGRINDQLSVDTHLGEDGAFYQCTLDLDAGGMLVSRNVPRNLTVNEVAQDYIFIPFAGLLSGSQPFEYNFTPIRDGDLASIDQLFYGIDWFDTSVPLFRRLREEAGYDRARITRQGLFQWRKANAIHENFRIPWHRVPTAYWSPIETYMLVEADLSGFEFARVSDDTGKVAVVIIESVSPITLPDYGLERDGEEVYLVELHSFVSSNTFSPFNETTVIEGIRTQRGTSGDLLRSLLINELRLTEEDVDIDSLYAYADPAWATDWLPVGGGADYRDIVEGILKSTRTSLVMQTDLTGRCRWTRVYVGSEAATDAIISIEPGDWVGAPSWGSDDRIVNEVLVKANFNQDPEKEDDFATETTFRSFSGQSIMGAAESEEVELYGLGAIPSPETAFLPLAQSLFYDFAEPRRTWSGTIGTYKGYFAGLGSVVQVSSPFLRGYSDQQGVSGLYGRVTEVEVNFWEEGCDLTIVHYGSKATGWNAACKVTQVINAAVVEVEANAFSLSTHPITGEEQLDIDAFAVGDEVYCEPALDQDAGVTRTIVALDRTLRRMQFSAAHGLAVGDHIAPTTYDNTSDLLVTYAYLADSNGLLGADDDDGFVLI